MNHLSLTFVTVVWIHKWLRYTCTALVLLGNCYASHFCCLLDSHVKQVSAWMEGKVQKTVVRGSDAGGTEEKAWGRAGGSRWRCWPAVWVRPRRTGSAARTPEGQQMLDYSGFEPREAIVGDWAEQKDAQVGSGSQEALRTKFIGVILADTSEPFTHE